MPMQVFGQATRFVVWYDDAGGTSARVVAQSVLNILESDLAGLEVHLLTQTGTGGGETPSIHPHPLIAYTRARTSTSR